ncbi:MAG: polyprenol monophosphomannose synthase [SAR324 cluster bacterium]|nr:polyprenol monophosphomannose synthase [SAR324 cluster bacterium]
MGRVLIFTATYNEVDNVEDLIEQIFQYLPGQNVLVVDDASPDGTGTVLDKMVESNDKIHVIHRTKKLGLGTAHKLAMKYAVHHGFDILITMDADFSHHPNYLPTIVEALAKHDFVIGSRYIEGGALDYGWFRTLISKTANLLARYLLNIPLKECTTSYRGFRHSLLKQINLDAIHSEGYSFFVESIFYVSRLSNKITEFPIHFEDRRAGASKISKTEIVKGMTSLMRLFYLRMFSSLSKIKAESSSEQSLHICIKCGGAYQTVIDSLIIQEKQEKGADDHSFSEHQSYRRMVQCLQCGLISPESHLQTNNNV